MTGHELQTVVMEMADDYIAILGEAVYLAAERIKEDSRARWLAQSFLRNGIGAALDIGSQPDPELGLLNMVVLVSLQRWAFENHWIEAGIGEENGAATLERLREAEAITWETAARVLSSDQRDDLRRLIEAWVAANPHRTVVSLVRFDDFTDARLVPDQEARQRASRLLREWRATITAVEDAILFGERAIWFASRFPYVVGQQAELTAYRLADQPELRDIGTTLRSIEALSGAVTSLSERLPDSPLDEAEAAAIRLSEATMSDLFLRVRRERTAALDDLESRQGQLAPFLTDLGATVDASARLASEVARTLDSVDGVLARFQTGVDDAPPLDMQELRRITVEAGNTATALARLLETTNETLDSPALSERIREARRLEAGLIDRAFWRALILIVVFLAGLAVVLVVTRRSRPAA